MKYHVTYEMMDRELRFSGKLIRTICPVMKESTYGMVNRGYRLFLKGKWKSEKTDCAFREIPREDGITINPPTAKNAIFTIVYRNRVVQFPSHFLLSPISF